MVNKPLVAGTTVHGGIVLPGRYEPFASGTQTP
jgi:hypothetical protein